MMRSLCLGLVGVALSAALLANYGRADEPLMKDARYYIVNVESGRCLGADTATIKQDGTKVQLFGTPSRDKPNQQWRIAKAGDGKYAIINAESGRYLDETKSIEKDGGKAELWGMAADNNPNRQWRIEKAGPDSYFIINVQSNRLLSADMKTLKEDVTVVHLFGKKGPDAPNNSKWKLEIARQQAAREQEAARQAEAARRRAEEELKRDRALMETLRADTTGALMMMIGAGPTPLMMLGPLGATLLLRDARPAAPGRNPPGGERSGSREAARPARPAAYPTAAGASSAAAPRPRCRSGGRGI
jgi:ricin-type beta-trefoil lectin protein